MHADVRAVGGAAFLEVASFWMKKSLSESLASSVCASCQPSGLLYVLSCSWRYVTTIRFSAVHLCCLM